MIERNWNMIYRQCHQAAVAFLPRHHLFYEDLVQETFMRALHYSDREYHFSRKAFWYFAAQGMRNLYNTNQQRFRGNSCSFDESYMVSIEHEFGDPIARKHLNELENVLKPSQVDALKDFVRDVGPCERAQAQGSTHQNMQQILVRALRNAKLYFVTRGGPAIGRPIANSGLCSKGCGKPRHKKNLCRNHYKLSLEHRNIARRAERASV